MRLKHYEESLNNEVIFIIEDTSKDYMGYNICYNLILKISAKECQSGTYWQHHVNLKDVSDWLIRKLFS